MGETRMSSTFIHMARRPAACGFVAQTVARPKVVRLEPGLIAATFSTWPKPSPGAP
jgi:hypothetical protein